MVWSGVEGCSGVEWYKLVLWCGLVWCGGWSFKKLIFCFQVSISTVLEFIAIQKKGHQTDIF